MNQLIKCAKMAACLIILWTAVTCVIQAFKCPEMTETERFLYIPKSFILQFKNCN